MAVTSYVRPDGAIVETDPNWTPGGYVVPASERGAPVAGINLAPVPNRVPAATLQAAAGRDVPMVRQGGSVIPAPPIYNNGRPTNVAWSIDPVNGSVSPLVGAYSAYPHVVYAPQRIGAGNLLATVLAGLQNNPYIGLAQASMPRQQGGGTGGAGRPGGTSGTGGTGGTGQRRPSESSGNIDIRTSVDRPVGQMSEEEAALMRATKNLLDTGDIRTSVDRPVGRRSEEEEALRSATRELYPVATPEEQALVDNAERLFAGTGLAAYTGALMRDEAVRRFGEYAGGRMGWSRFLATPQGRAILRGALGRMVTTGAIPLAVASAVSNILDYGEEQGMNIEGWNTSDDMALPEGF